MADNIFAPPSKEELADVQLFSPPTKEELLSFAQGQKPKDQFDSSKPYYNIPAVLKEELLSGHAPNAESNFGRTGALPLAAMGPPGMMTARTAGLLEPVGDVVGSASLGNAATAAAKAEPIKEGLMKAYETAKPIVKYGAQKLIDYGILRGLLRH